MGYLMYDQTLHEFDDRLLAHLRLAIVRKFRQHQSFFLNWTLPETTGGGRVSLWLDPTQKLEFRFADDREPELNMRWVKAMVDRSNPERGLHAISEKQAETYMKTDETIRRFAPEIEPLS